MFCQQQVVQLHREKHRIEEAGGRLIVIGVGKPFFIDGFRDKTGYDGEIYCDPGLRTYEALRLRRDLRSSLNTRTIRRAFRAYLDGNRQTRTQGDPWQQGGVFVVRADGEIVFRYASEYAGDHPPLRALLSALASANSGH